MKSPNTVYVLQNGRQQLKTAVDFFYFPSVMINIIYVTVCGWNSEHFLTLNSGTLIDSTRWSGNMGRQSIMVSKRYILCKDKRGGCGAMLPFSLDEMACSGRWLKAINIWSDWLSGEYCSLIFLICDCLKYSSYTVLI